MTSAIIAAAFTFTASATGVAKGTPVEFLFTGRDSDRDYEAMFAIDMPVADFARALEKAGLCGGKPVDPRRCQVWPVGAPVKIEPDISEFLSVDNSDGFSLGRLVYTGGLRTPDGVPVAASEMPASVCSLFSLSQSLFVPEAMINQGDAYGKFTALKTLKKGDKYAFTIKWNDSDRPRHLDLHVTPGAEAGLILMLKKESESSDLDVMATFDGELTVAEATQFARALELVDSVHVKVTGCGDGSLFFRAFLPMVMWTDRKNRMVQPFELVVNGDEDKLLFIDEDWTVEGDDPKLTPVGISFDEAKKKSKTDTCFIYAAPTTKLKRLYSSMSRLKGSQIFNWYVFLNK